MDKVYETTLLLDFYGQLLTDRQFEILDLHYNNDLTLTEIAEQLNISRQGVFDNEKRGKALLDEYENKLGLLSKFAEQKQKAEQVKRDLDKIDAAELSQYNRAVLEKVMQEIVELADSI
jgi:predicted DNA-binding protein YlxM (UPF0122 family)